VGYFAGASYARVASSIGKGSAIVVTVVVILGLVAWRVARKRNAGATDEEDEDVTASPETPWRDAPGPEG
jgi:hypothetical protein